MQADGRRNETETPARNFGVFFGGLCVTRCKKTAFVLTISRKLKIDKQIKAFDLLVNFWSERRDLNSRPPVPQTGALTGLRYAPNGRDYSGWVPAVQPMRGGTDAGGPRGKILCPETSLYLSPTRRLIIRKVNWILDADIRSFFDTISPEWLIRFLEHRIGDRRIIRLIQKWLKAGILEDGVVTTSEVGTGQGSVISPLLANICLFHVLDLYTERWRRREATGDVIIVRYADTTLSLVSSMRSTPGASRTCCASGWGSSRWRFTLRRAG